MFGIGWREVIIILIVLGALYLITRSVGKSESADHDATAK